MTRDHLPETTWGQKLMSAPVNTVWDNEDTRESFPVQGHLITVDKNRFFFQHYGLTEHDLERYLAAALSAGGEYADLYFEYLSSTSLMVDESMVKSASQGISAGCGVRVVSGERTGYAYTDDLSSERILHAARTAALIASGPAKTPVGRLPGEGRAQPVSGDASVRRCRNHRQSRTGDARRPVGPRLRSAHQGSSRQLRRRIAQHSGGRFRRHICRGLAAAGSHERFLHRQDRRQFRSRQFRRRRTRRPRLLLRGKNSRVLRQGSRPSGHPATRRSRSSGRRNGSRARSRLARRSAARSRRPRPGGRFQPQADFGVCRTHRQARSQRKMHGGG